MKVYLVRHGDSINELVDPMRPLSEKGREEVTRVAQFLANKITVMNVYHSSKLRAKETAEILAKNLNPQGKITMQRGLEPNDEVDDMVLQLEALPDAHDILIAGHLPYLAKLVARLASGLIFGNENNLLVDFGPATIICLERIGVGHWVINWMLRPEILPPASKK